MFFPAFVMEFPFKQEEAEGEGMTGAYKYGKDTFWHKILVAFKISLWLSSFSPVKLATFGIVHLENVTLKKEAQKGKSSSLENIQNTGSQGCFTQGIALNQILYKLWNCVSKVSTPLRSHSVPDRPMAVAVTEAVLWNDQILADLHRLEEKLRPTRSVVAYNKVWGGSFHV